MPIYEPVNPVREFNQGLLQALVLSRQLRQRDDETKYQHEQDRLDRERQTRLDRIAQQRLEEDRAHREQEIQFKARQNRFDYDQKVLEMRGDGYKDVNDRGQVDAPITLPALQALTVDGTDLPGRGATTMHIPRPAEQSRVFDLLYGGRMESPTPEESADRAGQRKARAYQAELDERGLPTTPLMQRLLGIDRVMPEQYGGISNAVTHEYETTNPQPKEVAPENRPLTPEQSAAFQKLLGIKIPDGVPITGKQATDAIFDKGKQDRAPKEDPGDKLRRTMAEKLQSSIEKIEEDKQKLHAENIAIGEEMKSLSEQTKKGGMLGGGGPLRNDLVSRRRLTVDLPAKLAANKLNLSGMALRQKEMIDRKDKLYRGEQPKQAPAQESGATQPTSKTATSDQVKAYAQRKGITPEAAAQEFKASGYAVQ